MKRIGFITGIEIEANILRKGSQYSKSKIISVSNTESNAYTEANEMVKSGCEILVSFGFAGALDPKLSAGDLVIPNAVVDTEGNIFEANYNLHKNLTSHFSKELKPSSGKLFGSECVIWNANEKKRIFERFDTTTVDMESLGVAKAANEGNCSFVVVRAISDTAYQNLPKESLKSFYLSNSIKLGDILIDLTRNLRELPEFLQLAQNSQKAYSCLKNVTRLGFGI